MQTDQEQNKTNAVHSELPCPDKRQGKYLYEDSASSNLKPEKITNISRLEKITNTFNEIFRFRVIYLEIPDYYVRWAGLQMEFVCSS